MNPRSRLSCGRRIESEQERHTVQARTRITRGTQHRLPDALETIQRNHDGFTFSPDNPRERRQLAAQLGRRIDYILVRCDEKRPTLRIRDCRRLFDIPSTASGPAIISDSPPTSPPPTPTSTAEADTSHKPTADRCTLEGSHPHPRPSENKLRPGRWIEYLADAAPA